MISMRGSILGLFLGMLMAMPARSWSQPVRCEAANWLIAQTGRPGRENDEPPVEDEAREKMKKDMEKKANQQRHAELKRDTERLLQLSTELKQYVDKTNENLLSVEVVNKAEQIEKLAHSVKEKMKGN